MSYNYELCFWDPNDEGVNVLLEHILAGIKSCHTMVNFFKQRGELEKDYARRLGAINSKLHKDMEHNPEYGHLSRSFELMLSNEKARAQAHSKQSEIIYRQIYSDIKSFADKLQARYTTLSGKIERLRMDKYNKKVGCENLEKRLQEAQTKARDLHLNQDNVIGAKRNEHNQKELIKWETTAQEMALKLDVLKQEHKASQKYWFREWANVARDLQEIDNTRISFLKSKLQQYAECSIETSVLEQTRMDSLTNQLVIYTPADDIAEFSSAYGTGRLREKRKSHGAGHSTKNREASDLSRKDSFGASRSDSRDSYDESTASKSRRSSYMDNLRRLSSHLQTIGTLNDSKAKRYSTPPAIERESSDEPHEQLYRSTVREARVIHPQSPAPDIDDSTYRSHHLQPRPSPNHRKDLSSSSSTSSSNPTDFTAHVKNRHSMDSMATSVSSFANSIDDSQRFAKSWNSSNRKRKSVSYVQQQSPPPSAEYHHGDSDDFDTPHRRDHQAQHTKLRDVSTETTIVNPDMNSEASHNRRRSMVLKDSPNPIEDALYEMEKISSNGFAASDVRVGRIRDSGITVTLPLVTSNGEKVVRYAKAIYPLAEGNVSELAQFQKGDYLLLTGEVNEEWYKGEVYSNDYVNRENSSGLIPHNFIKLLT
ncbi:related to Cytokinesis protein 2 [Zygosaccharomyces bailii ISA1307]|nr:related to Cytokinesis protein 2 [Zygosaccharomyces bailii ISA1307]